MAPRKGRKAKRDTVAEGKIKEIKKVQDFFKNQVNVYEAYLNTQCSIVCGNISKLYNDRLKAIPENIRNMTISQLMELSNEEKDQEATESKVLQSHIERHRVMSEKKKTQRKSKSERKRSLSVSVCSSIHRNPAPSMTNPLNRQTRTVSDTNLNTPLAKRSVSSVYVVTPKFDPRAKVIQKNLLRKPRAGELVMSLSGSPLQNIMDDIATKPIFTLPLGGGQVINIGADTEIEKLQRNFGKMIDDETKNTL